MKYSADEIRQTEKLPDAPFGQHVMTCVLEKPSTKDGVPTGKHTFLFKNNEFQVWFNFYPSQLKGLAAKFLVPLEPDGSVDTELFKGKRVKLTVGEALTRTGVTYKTCTDFELIPSEASDSIGETDTEDFPF